MASKRQIAKEAAREATIRRSQRQGQPFQPGPPANRMAQPIHSRPPSRHPSQRPLPPLPSDADVFNPPPRHFYPGGSVHNRTYNDPVPHPPGPSRLQQPRQQQFQRTSLHVQHVSQPVPPHARRQSFRSPEEWRVPSFKHQTPVAPRPSFQVQPRIDPPPISGGVTRYNPLFDDSGDPWYE